MPLSDPSVYPSVKQWLLAELLVPEPWRTEAMSHHLIPLAPIPKMLHEMLCLALKNRAAPTMSLSANSLAV